MRWHNRERSANVEDRRGRRPGFGGRMPMKRGSVLLLIAVAVAGYYGVDLTPLLGETMKTREDKSMTTATHRK